MIINKKHAIDRNNDKINTKNRCFSKDLKIGSNFKEYRILEMKHS